MGVKDLTAVIKRYCPGVIRQLSGRWRELRGSTVAIDGTLLTQRFYYGREGHLVSYMRLLDEARRNDIKLVAVFDGAKRLSQKHRESARREASRVLLQSRLGAEVGRYERLVTIERLYAQAVAKQDYAGVHEQIERVNAGAPTQTHPTPSQVLLGAQERSLYATMSSITQHNQSGIDGVAPQQSSTHSQIEAEFAALKLTTNETIIRYSKKPPTAATYERVRQLLSAAGVPTLIVNQDPVHEGEALASALVLGGLADYVLSEDTDVLIYGAKLIRDGVGSLRVFDGSLLQSSLGLSGRELVDFALLCGTDFSLTIPSVGPIRALQHIRQFGSIEKIIQHHSNLAQLIFDKRGVSVDCFLHEVAEARRVYETLPAIPTSIAFGEYDHDAVRKILSEEKIDLSTKWGEDDDHYTQLKVWGM